MAETVETNPFMEKWGGNLNEEISGHLSLKAEGIDEVPSDARAEVIDESRLKISFPNKDSEPVTITIFEYREEVTLLVDRNGAQMNMRALYITLELLREMTGKLD